MHWLKIILLVSYGMGVIFSIAQSAGWEVKPWSPLGLHAIPAVIKALMFVGIWVWL